MIYTSVTIAIQEPHADDILLIYDASRTNPDNITQYSNTIHRNLQLNPTLEANDRVILLGLLTITKASQLEIDIFRKPTTTDTTSATYPTTQVNINLRHTDTRLRGCSTSPSIMTDYTMTGKPSSTLQKTTNSQLPFSTN